MDKFKIKSNKLIEKNTGENCDLRVGEKFLDMTSKAGFIKILINCNLSKLRKSVLWKTLLKE